MLVNKVRSVVFLLFIFVMGCDVGIYAQVSFRDFGLRDSTDQLQSPLYLQWQQDTSFTNLNLEFPQQSSFDGYGILGVVPFKKGMARIGNITLNKNVQTAAELFLDAFVLPSGLDYPMHINFNERNQQQQYAPPQGSPQFKLKIGN